MSEYEDIITVSENVEVHPGAVEGTWAVVCPLGRVHSEHGSKEDAMAVAESLAAQDDE